MQVTVTLTLNKPDGSPQSGAVVMARVASSTINATTDASGVASFALTAGDRVRFMCSQSKGLDGLTVTIPRVPQFTVGVFGCDALSEAETSGAAWGAITGTIGDQTDLANALDAKATLTPDQQAAINGAASPSAGNVFATMADVGEEGRIGGRWTFFTGDDPLLPRNIDYSILPDAQKALLTSLDLSEKGLSEPPILTGCTALTELYLNSNDLTDAPNLTGLTALESLGLGSNGLTTAPDLTGLTALTVLYLSENALTTAPDLTGLTALAELNLGGNALTTAPDLTGLTALETLQLNDNALPTAEVNSVLTQLDALGATDGFVDLSGGTNGIPDGDGLTAISNLEGKNWTVTVNTE